MRGIIRGVANGLAGAVQQSVAEAASSEYTGGALRYGALARVVMTTAAAAFLALATGLILEGQDSPLLALLMSAPPTVLALWLLLEAFFVRGRITATHLELYSPWRGERRVPWVEFLGYRYSVAGQWHVLSTRGWGRVRLPLWLSGGDDVIRLLMRRGQVLHPSWAAKNRRKR